MVGTAFVTAAVALGADGSFSTSFSFRVHSNSGTSDVDGVGGSGVAFLMQRDGPTAQADTLPTGYGAYGNEFRPRSVTVKFDTYDNSVTNCNCNDVSGNFVGLMLDGSYDSVAQDELPDKIQRRRDLLRLDRFRRFYGYP